MTEGVTYRNPSQGIEAKAVVSLALIESRVEDGKRDNDRLGLFMPLVTDALHGLEGTRFRLADVQDRVRRTSGLELPQTVVKALMSRATRRGLVRRINGAYERTDKTLPYNDVSARKREIEADYMHLVEGLCRFASSREIGELGQERAHKILSEYFDENFRSLSIGRLPDSADSSLPDGQEDDAPDYMRFVGQYLYEAIKSDTRILSTAVTQVRGRIVYDAAFLPGFSEGEQRLSGLVCYLDSPVVCDALGYGTLEDEAVALESIDTLKGVGVTCKVLEVTVNEIGSILTHVYENWGHPKDNEAPNSYAYCMHRKYDRGYVLRVSSNPATEISNVLDLPIVPTPDRNSAYVRDEAALAERLRRREGTVEEARIWHDVNCVATVLTVRRGKRAGSIGKSKAFFLSQSYLTIKNVGKWWQIDEHRDDLPPIFPLVSLANYAWLYDGKDKTKSLAKESLVATCAASMMPSESSWYTFVRKVEEYVDRGQLEQQVAMDYLYSMDARAVVSEAMAVEPIDEILTNATMDMMLGEVDKRLANRAYGEELKKQSSAIGSLMVENAELKQSIEDGQKIADEQCRRADESDRAYEGERMRLEKIVDCKARKMTKIVVVITVIVFAALFITLAVWQSRCGISTDHPMFAVTLLGLVFVVIPFIPAVREWVHECFKRHYHREWIE